jgi:hypothetical protein
MNKKSNPRTLTSSVDLDYITVLTNCCIAMTVKVIWGGEQHIIDSVVRNNSENDNNDGENDAPILGASNVFLGLLVWSVTASSAVTATPEVQ